MEECGISPQSLILVSLTCALVVRLLRPMMSINEHPPPPLTSLRSTSKVRTRTHTWSILKIGHVYNRGGLPTWICVIYFTVRNRTACIFLYFWIEQFPIATLEKICNGFWIPENIRFTVNVDARVLQKV